jgi:hypothetical protein
LNDRSVLIVNAAIDRAGVPFLETPITIEEIESWYKDHIMSTRASSADNVLSQKLASQKPHWPLGQGFMGYHPLTLGFYVSELVKRLDPQHRGVQQFFAQEIAAPLAPIALEREYQQQQQQRTTNRLCFDRRSNQWRSTERFESSSAVSADGKSIEFHIGVPESFDARNISRLFDGSISAEREAIEAQKVQDEQAYNVPSDMRINTSQQYCELEASATYRAFRALRKFSPWHARSFEVPAAIGYTNAAALGFIYSVLLETLTSPSTAPALFDAHALREATTMATMGFDNIMQQPNRAYTRGGFVLDSRHPHAFHHSGTGGSVGWADPSIDVAFAYTTNALAGGLGRLYRREALIAAIYQCAGRVQSIANRCKL